MRSLRNTLLLTAIGLAVSAVSADGDHKGHTALPQNDPRTLVSHASFAATPQHVPSHGEKADDSHLHGDTTHSHDYTPDDHVALEEMRNHVAAHFGPCDEIPGTFAVTEDWDHTYTYRQVQFRVANGEPIRICHATNRHDHTRFAALWNEHEGHYESWVQVH
jgi:hypothetical protein